MKQRQGLEKRSWQGWLLEWWHFSKDDLITLLKTGCLCTNHVTALYPSFLICKIRAKTTMAQNAPSGCEVLRLRAISLTRKFYKEQPAPLAHQMLTLWCQRSQCCWSTTSSINITLLPAPEANVYSAFTYQGFLVNAAITGDTTVLNITDEFVGLPHWLTLISLHTVINFGLLFTVQILTTKIIPVNQCQCRKSWPFFDIIILGK